MAIDKETLKVRSLTALVFVCIMLAGLFLNAWSFISLMVFIMVGCLYEFFRIVRLINANKVFLFLPYAIVYIVLPIVMLISLGINPPAGVMPGVYSPLFPCAIIFSIWINDTMAYLVGSMIGKTRLSTISPKKTVEGTVGGMILCVIIIGFFSYLIPEAAAIPVIHWLSIAAISAVFGTLGDLIESKLKRRAGVKDSGKIMPGHGGFLDRFDSMLVAAPFVWLYCKFMF